MIIRKNFFDKATELTLVPKSTKQDDFLTTLEENIKESVIDEVPTNLIKLRIFVESV
jgi:hypothetical protein